MTTTQSKFVHVNPGKPKPPKLEVRTDPDGTRFYRSPKGIWYPSASTVAGWEKKDFFAEWAKNPQNAIEADRARQRGNLLHEVTERYLNNEEGYLDSFGHNTRYKMLFQQIKPHLKKINLIRAQELAMYSDTIQMAGRVDCVTDYEGELSIIDFKGFKRPEGRVDRALPDSSDGIRDHVARAVRDCREADRHYHRLRGRQRSSVRSESQAICEATQGSD